MISGYIVMLQFLSLAGFHFFVHINGYIINYFHNVLLIVHYNYDVSEENLLLHNKIWDPIFCNQIIFAPINNTRIVQLKTNLANKLTAIDIVSSIDDPRGLFAYNVLCY